MEETTNKTPETPSDKPQVSPDELKKIEARVKRAELLADALDNKYLDPIIGALIPEGGDAATALASLYIVYEAKRMDMPTMELAKMLGRTGVDFLGGAVPIVGDVFDFIYKSNKSNALAMREHFEKIKAEAEENEMEMIAHKRDELKEDVERGKAA